MFDSAIDFELSVLDLAWPGHELGILYEEPDPLTDEPDDPERTMIPVGSTYDRNATLFMGPRGEIAYYLGYVAMRNESILTCLEQHAMIEVHSWDTPRFIVNLWPPIGKTLAGAMSLVLVEEASDTYTAWWKDGDAELRHVSFCEGTGARMDFAVLRSVDALVRVLEAMSAVCPDMRANVAANPTQSLLVSKQQWKQLPAMDEWASAPGARRYVYGQEGDGVTGVIWVLGEPGTRRIEQYCITDGALFRWETFTCSGGVRREVEY